MFTLNVTCGSVPGEGDLMIDLTSTVNNSMQLLTSFLITKDCGEGFDTNTYHVAVSKLCSNKIMFECYIRMLANFVLRGRLGGTVQCTCGFMCSFVICTFSLHFALATNTL